VERVRVKRFNRNQFDYLNNWKIKIKLNIDFRITAAWLVVSDLRIDIAYTGIYIDWYHSKATNLTLQ